MPSGSTLHSLFRRNMNNVISPSERYAPYTIGVEDIFRNLDKIYDSREVSNYPPYNSIKYADGSYLIQLSVAGFRPADIEVSSERNVLTIKAGPSSMSTASDKDATYQHKGLATRPFKKSWVLDSDMVVGTPRLENGVLEVGIRREIPEHLQKRVFPISSGDAEMLPEVKE